MNSHLFDALIAIEARNDKALARVLGISQPYLCNIRAERNLVSPSMMIRIHEEFDMPIHVIKKLIARPLCGSL